MKAPADIQATVAHNDDDRDALIGNMEGERMRNHRKFLPNLCLPDPWQCVQHFIYRTNPMRHHAANFRHDLVLLIAKSTVTVYIISGNSYNHQIHQAFLSCSRNSQFSNPETKYGLNLRSIEDFYYW